MREWRPRPEQAATSHWRLVHYLDREAQHPVPTLSKKPRRRKRIPTDRWTLEWVARQGWIGDLAERRTGIVARDFLGFADVVALIPQGRVVAIQHTSKGNMSSRRNKVLNSPEACLWAIAGGRVLVLGWRPDGTVAVEELTQVLAGG